jgi:hypothetical protein
MAKLSLLFRCPSYVVLLLNCVKVWDLSMCLSSHNMKMFWASGSDRFNHAEKSHCFIWNRGLNRSGHDGKQTGPAVEYWSFTTLGRVSKDWAAQEYYGPRVTCHSVRHSTTVTQVISVTVYSWKDTGYELHVILRTAAWGHQNVRCVNQSKIAAIVGNVLTQHGDAAFWLW